MVTLARSTVARPDARPGQSSPERLLVGRLRLDLSAFGIDPTAPDFAERFFKMANDNEPYTFEYSGNGELIVMPPAGWESNIGENETNADLAIWRRENGGYACSQNVQFQLPSGAVYIPDAAWITQERYDALRTGEYASTISGAPDFVVEVRSRTDRLAAGLAKMEEWMDGGSRLGWYINPYERRVHVFRAGREIEVLDDPETLTGEDVLPGFVLEVRRLVFARYDELNDNGD
ncbi:MAG: Uma2 family endonuclease [Chloroflexi bacterium]|nr:Uma2 family endonuclease [Chloroflexota bacterium]